MKKKLILIIILLITILPITTQAKEEYILDYANLIKEDGKEYINEYSDFLYNKVKFKYYVVTIESLEDKTIEDITSVYFNNLGIKENGMLILYAKEEKEIRVELGLKPSTYINNVTVESYIDNYILPYLVNEEYEQGILNGYKSYYKLICENYKIDSTEIEIYNANNFFEKYKSYILMFLAWLSITSTYFICSFIKKMINRKKNVSKKDITLFSIAVAINLIILFIAYYIKPITILIILGFQIIAIYGSFTNTKALDLNEIKRLEYEREMKEKEKLRKKQLKRKLQQEKMKNKPKTRKVKGKRTNSDLDSMLKKTK